MRVAIVTPRFPPDLGGLESYVGWVAATLVEHGCHVTVIAASSSRRRTQHTWRGVRVLRLASWGTVSNTPVNALWWRQVPRLLRELDVDVVNAHAPVPGMADIAAFTSPAPVVVTYHSGSLVKGNHPVDPVLRAYERHVLPRVFANAAALVAVSPVSMAYSTDRSHVIPPGVDTQLFTPGEDAEPPTKRILYVGRIERTSRWKGLHVLVEAMARLKQMEPGVVLDMVGDGDDVATLQAQATTLGVADNIVWHGAVAHADLPPFYRRAAVAVLPSLTESESFGMTLIEAMASGRPVVGSRAGGIPFVIRDGVDGVLVPPGDPVALAEALSTVLTDPALAARLGRAGREAAESRWDWTHQDAATLRVLTEAARFAPARLEGTR
jgi:glycosyltransferase involved in cell wall biosynthesis